MALNSLSFLKYQELHVDVILEDGNDLVPSELALVRGPLHVEGDQGEEPMVRVQHGGRNEERPIQLGPYQTVRRQV